MNLIFKAPFNATYGYARVTELFLKEFRARGIQLHCLPIQGVIDEKYKYLIRPISKEEYDKCKEFVIFPLSFDLYNRPAILKTDSYRPLLLYTMWEVSRVNTFIIREFNNVSTIVVPCQWNKEVFLQSGTTVPIEVVPLGIDTSIFSYQPPSSNDFVFGTGNNDFRKRLKDVLRCFCRAFHPRIRDVKLKIKVSPQDNLGAFADERIEVLNKNLSQQELAKWYHGIDVFVSAAYAEGWGLMQHEAMACGRPLISPWYGGVKDFFDKDCGYCVDYREILASGPYEYSGGFWADFNEDDMIDKMRWCYNNRSEVHKKGILSAERVKNLTENNTINQILQIMKEIK